MLDRLTNWLETHWVTPAFSGWLLAGFTIFFFAAATNTMAGWLYVMSGVLLALLLLAAVLPARSLRNLTLHRLSIAPVSQGETLTIALELENQSTQAKTLLQLQDHLPRSLVPAGQPLPQTPIEQLAGGDRHRWQYHLLAQQRGIYRWEAVSVRSGAPLGLFWCRRVQPISAKAVIYPIVLPLTQCPLIDQLGRDAHEQLRNLYQTQTSTEGLTRTLRPYRWGDSTRLIHWRTSARYGELRVRELENYTGGQELVLCLDTRSAWETAAFEQAVIAAASLYFYATQHHLKVSLWLPEIGSIHGDRPVLEALATVQPQASQPQSSRSQDRAKLPKLPELSTAASDASLPNLPLLWLSSNAATIQQLPLGSRWLLWRSAAEPQSASTQTTGAVIEPEQPLQIQLQQSPLVTQTEFDRQPQPAIAVPHPEATPNG